jgi:hypothetical protein
MLAALFRIEFPLISAGKMAPVPLISAPSTPDVNE